MAVDLLQILQKWTNVGPLIGPSGFLLHSIEEAKTTVSQVQDIIGKLAAAGINEAEAKETRAALLYDKIEQEGKSPDDFWAGIPQEVKDDIGFSPEAIRRSMQRTKFLGLGSALLFVAAAVASGIAILRGVPIAVKTLAAIKDAKALGASVGEIANILEAAKVAALPKVGIPAVVSGLLTAAGWQASSWANNLNDVDFWGREQLRQAEESFNKERDAKERAEQNKLLSQTLNSPKTRITMAKTAKPQLFLGTIFSSRVKNTAAFERVVDDRIDSKEELQADAQANLNKWLSTLPGRLIYTIDIRKDPYDENGIKQTGTWATMTILSRSVGGKTAPIDTILLGPVDPTVYYPKSQEVLSVQNELPKLLTAEEIANIDFVSKDIKLVDKTGNMVPFPIPGGTTTAVEQPKPTPAPVPTPTPQPAPQVSTTPAPVSGTSPSGAQVVPGLVSQEDYRERGLPVPPGIPSRAALAAAQPSPTPSPTGDPERDFKVGDIVVVSAGGEGLNLRKDYGLGAAKVFAVPDGTRLRINGGPFPPGNEKLDGYVWIAVVYGDQEYKVASKFLRKV